MARALIHPWASYNAPLFHLISYIPREKWNNLPLALPPVNGAYLAVPERRFSPKLGAGLVRSY